MTGRLDRHLEGAVGRIDARHEAELAPLVLRSHRLERYGLTGLGVNAPGQADLHGGRGADVCQPGIADVAMPGTQTEARLADAARRAAQAMYPQRQARGAGEGASRVGHGLPDLR